MTRPDSTLDFTSLLTAIVRLGVPAVIALGLVYFLAGSVSAELRDVKAAIGVHATDTRDTLRLLQAICLNTATTPAERANCEVR
jgi:hypothetical protein